MSCCYRKRSQPYCIYFCGIKAWNRKFLWLSLHRALGHNLNHQLKDDGKDLTILTVNIESINAKFENLYPVINNLSSMGLYFGATCLQETWLSSHADVSLLHIPGYKLIHQGSRCSRHGGLVIYLHEQYTYKLRNMYMRSDIWEGLFIDVSGHNLHRPITIGNIYRPPHNNNNNANIETFIEEMSPIINTLQKENKYATIVGDFNINLQQINEREKIEEFFDLMCTNIFFSKNYSSNPQLKAILYFHWSIVLQVTAFRSRECFLSNHNEQHFRPLPVLGKTRNCKGWTKTTQIHTKANHIWSSNS